MNDVRAATIGKFLRDARVSAGLTQRDVSAKMGYTSAQFVSNWERGVCAPPTHTLRKLARILRLPADQLSSAFKAYLKQAFEVEVARIERLLGV